MAAIKKINVNGIDYSIYAINSDRVGGLLPPPTSSSGDYLAPLCLKHNFELIFQYGTVSFSLDIPLALTPSCISTAVNSTTAVAFRQIKEIVSDVLLHDISYNATDSTYTCQAGNTPTFVPITASGCVRNGSQVIIVSQILINITSASILESAIRGFYIREGSPVYMQISNFASTPTAIIINDTVLSEDSAAS